MRWLKRACLLFCLAVPLARAEDPQKDPAKPANRSDACVDCHSGDPSAVMELGNHEKLSIYVDRAGLAKSVHDSLGCVDCHADKGDYPHEGKPFENRRAVSIAYYKLCDQCHSPNDIKTQSGVHQAALAERHDTRAALCIDCHGFHEVSRPSEPRSKISETCAKCHRQVFETYVESVHGKALFGGNPDVPVCTDCHRAHEIPRASDGTFALRAPETCGACHTNPKLMEKYGLSTGVVRTYLADFHGMSATLQRNEKNARRADFAASCTDCHGVHDIRRVHDPDSRVVQANLVKTCRKCHPGASENFPGAWLSHYEPTMKKAGAVYLVQLFYKFMIPFMLAGLVLQIGLHIFRVVVNR